MACQDFRGHIAICAHDELGFRLAIRDDRPRHIDLARKPRSEDARYAEVGKHHMFVFAQKNVAELDVAVDDALRVDVVERLAQIVKPVEDVVLFEIVQFNVIQRMRRAVLVGDHVHDEVRNACRLVNGQVEHADEMRIAQPRQHLAFCQKLLLEDIDIPALRSKRLQRVVNAELFVFDFIDRPHPALSKKADYSVCADFMSRSKCHSFYPCRHSAIERKENLSSCSE